MGRRKAGQRVRADNPLYLWHHASPELHSLAYLEEQTARAGHRLHEPTLSAFMSGKRHPSARARAVMAIASLGCILAGEAEWFEYERAA